MPARLTAFPAYTVFDQTAVATVSHVFTNTLSSPVTNVTGTDQSMRDNNLTTYLGVTNTGSSNDGFIQPSPEFGALVTFDFGRIIWNTVIYAKYNIGGGTTQDFSYSDDNTNWIALNTTGGLTEAAYAVFKFRYLRFFMHRNDPSASTAFAVYEVKVMGSNPL